MLINYKEELNPSQLAAVEYCDGPSLVIAGAGSGKTRVLTYKIAYLLEHGYEPWSIMALTFTNKAAKEMKERIAARVGERNARMLWMNTFHSIFAKILRREAQHLGYEPNFTIYDQSDSKSLVRTIVKEMQLDEKIYKPSTVVCLQKWKIHLRRPRATCSLLWSMRVVPTACKATNARACRRCARYIADIATAVFKPMPWTSTTC